jgi:hypothetical protein
MYKNDHIRMYKIKGKDMKNMIIECTKAQEKWEAKVEVIKTTKEKSELIISSRGSKMHIVVGKYAQGNYLCIPMQGVGCELADLSDEFWNSERISQQLNLVDAISISTALKAFKLEIQ